MDRTLRISKFSRVVYFFYLFKFLSVVSEEVPWDRSVLFLVDFDRSRFGRSLDPFQNLRVSIGTLFSLLCTINLINVLIIGNKSQCHKRSEWHKQILELSSSYLCYAQIKHSDWLKEVTHNRRLF